MGRRLRGEPWSEISLRISGAVVAHSIKVLYVPTPKVACSSLKRLIAEAAGTFDESALNRLTTPNITPEQAIHEPEVNGFTYFRNLTDGEQAEILGSPEWWRVAAFRNPYARAYSAFENNWLLFAGTMRETFRGRYREVLTDGCINLTETFAAFLESLVENRETFFIDGHFRPQLWQVSPDAVDYTHVFKVDSPGALDDFARQLSERTAHEVRPRRINEGLGLTYRDILTADLARRIEYVYEPDFDTLGYAREDFPEVRDPWILSEQETRLVHVVQRMWLRQWQMSVAARGMRGFRYGARQIMSRTRESLLGFVGRPPVFPEEGDT